VEIVWSRYAEKMVNLDQRYKIDCLIRKIAETIGCNYVYVGTRYGSLDILLHHIPKEVSE